MSSEIGMMLHTGDVGWDDLVRLAQECQDLGFDGFWLTEEAGKEAFSALGVLAGETTSIRLCTSIVNFYSRTPTLLAMAARSIHELSGGRFGPFGLGTGGIGFMQRGHGIDLDRPLARARETVEIVRGLLSEDRFSYDGKWFKVDDFRLREGPIGDGTPPVYLAGLGPQMVGMAAKVADGVISNWLTEESLADYRAMIGDAAAAAGRDPGEVKIATLSMMCADPNDEEAVAAMRRGLAFYCASRHYRHIAELCGLSADFDRVAEKWTQREFDEAAALVTDAMVEKFSMTGSDDECRAYLKWLQSENVYPIIYPLARKSHLVEDHFLVARRAIELAR
jgi:alkanesulfonate monooxygenase SsuD/methylene tetrahydromethanopterin reductase-like flavin-dependent oxidoreductase (luciferase family)